MARHKKLSLKIFSPPPEICVKNGSPPLEIHVKNGSPTLTTHVKNGSPPLFLNFLYGTISPRTENNCFVSLPPLPPILRQKEGVEEAVIKLKDLLEENKGGLELFSPSANEKNLFS